MTLIAAIGIPGSGKSAVMHALGVKLGCKVFHEPEECDWPPAVTGRCRYGYLGSITWFRSQRVPHLIDAFEISSRGGTAIVDSYYDKLIYHYLGYPGLEWLAPSTDSYYDVVKEIARLDYKYLPDADVLVGFRITEEVWNNFLQTRGRKMNGESGFRTVIMLQDPMFEAARKWEADNEGTRLLEFDQEVSSPEAMAQKVLDRGTAEGLM